MTARKVNVREWELALIDAALDTMELWTIRGYVRRQKATIA